MRVQYSARGIPTYSLELEHVGLHKFKVVRDKDMHALRRKAEMEAAAWNAVWKKRASEQATKEQHAKAAATARERTEKAGSEIVELHKLLYRALEIDDAIDWSSLKDNSSYPVERPRPAKIREIEEIQKPRRPEVSDPNYVPRLSFLDRTLRIFGRIPSVKIDAAQSRFEYDFREWERAGSAIDKQIESDRAKHQERLEKAKADHEFAIEQWQCEKAAFKAEQIRRNSEVEQRELAYRSKLPAAILRYCSDVLDRSDYPKHFPKKFEMELGQDNGLLVIDYLLPSLEDMPTISEVKYVQSRKDFSVKNHTESERTKLYEDVLYQITLRTLHELFEADVIESLTAIAFNGWVAALNKATGHIVTNCILSLQCSNEEFGKINLSAAQPRECFKQLKGVAASKLASLTPIAPLVRLDKNDHRFVTSYNVIANSEGVNLAAMDWQDFEHLVRELFEKEFGVNGGEVKVTQASRDGGVDAIAFDPDPIRGGKIVIQAKRYTNVVGVSSVRDLYGTVMNEGATKGILVTTTDYGPDAYEFARNKPLTLLNGSNLLFLLQKHGQQARIDIKEAKRYFAEQSPPTK